MSTRRKGRECALQILYQIDTAAKNSGALAPGESLLSTVSRAKASEAINNFFHHFEAPKAVLDHAASLVFGVIANAPKIDSSISQHSDKWKIDRMAQVDKNVLRIACYEIILAKELSANIIIDEAIEIAKKFGTEKSAAFVNGILDSIAADFKKS